MYESSMHVAHVVSVTPDSWHVSDCLEQGTGLIQVLTIFVVSCDHGDDSVPCT